MRDINSSQMTAVRRARAEGEAEGEARGKLEQAIITFLQLVKWKLGMPPASLRSRIRKMTDVAEINRLYEFVLKQASTIEELVDEIR